MPGSFLIFGYGRLEYAGSRPRARPDFLLQSCGFLITYAVFLVCVISGHIAVGVAFNGRVALLNLHIFYCEWGLLGLLP